jgi:hypothetical protein
MPTDGKAKKTKAKYVPSPAVAKLARAKKDAQKVVKSIEKRIKEQKLKEKSAKKEKDAENLMTDLICSLNTVRNDDPFGDFGASGNIDDDFGDDDFGAPKNTNAVGQISGNSKAHGAPSSSSRGTLLKPMKKKP